MRHSATKSLLERRDVLVVASVSCIYGIASPPPIRGSSRARRERADSIGTRSSGAFVAVQYERNDTTSIANLPRARRRIEVFPRNEESIGAPVELFGDVIDRSPESIPYGAPCSSASIGSTSIRRATT